MGDHGPIYEEFYHCKRNVNDNNCFDRVAKSIVALLNEHCADGEIENLRKNNRFYKKYYPITDTFAERDLFKNFLHNPNLAEQMARFYQKEYIEEHNKEEKEYAKRKRREKAHEAAVREFCMTSRGILDHECVGAMNSGNFNR